MQMIAIIAFMVALPIVSIAIDVSTAGTPMIIALGKWFVFWGVGWRLATAAIHQAMRPAFTAKAIFEVEDPRATKLVLEIAFGNFALGATAIASLYFPTWVPTMAMAGAIFYGLAGFQHVRNKATKSAEIAAMVSDLGIAAILLIYLGLLAIAD
jgi:hypothetical protein